MKKWGFFADDTVTYTNSNRLRVGLGLQQPTGSWTNGFGYDEAKRLTSVVSPARAFNEGPRIARIDTNLGRHFPVS